MTDVLFVSFSPGRVSHAQTSSVDDRGETAFKRETGLCTTKGVAGRSLRLRVDPSTQLRFGLRPSHRVFSQPPGDLSSQALADSWQFLQPLLAPGST